MTELLPCPFCGDEDLEIDNFHYFDENRTDYYEVHCTCCGARSGEWEDKGDAIKAWNRRHGHTTTMTTDTGSQHWYSCDTCEHDGYAAELPNFCPHCGRKVMRDGA